MTSRASGIALSRLRSARGPSRLTSSRLPRTSRFATTSNPITSSSLRSSAPFTSLYDRYSAQSREPSSVLSVQAIRDLRKEIAELKEKVASLTAGSVRSQVPQSTPTGTGTGIAPTTNASASGGATSTQATGKRKLRRRRQNLLGFRSPDAVDKWIAARNPITSTGTLGRMETEVEAIRLQREYVRQDLDDNTRAIQKLRSKEKRYKTRGRRNDTWTMADETSRATLMEKRAEIEQELDALDEDISSRQAPIRSIRTTNQLHPAKVDPCWEETDLIEKKEAELKELRRRGNSLFGSAWSLANERSLNSLKAKYRAGDKLISELSESRGRKWETSRVETERTGRTYTGPF